MTTSTGTWSTRPWVLPIGVHKAFSGGCIHAVVLIPNKPFVIYGYTFEMKEGDMPLYLDYEANSICMGYGMDFLFI